MVPERGIAIFLYIYIFIRFFVSLSTLCPQGSPSRWRLSPHHTGRYRIDATFRSSQHPSRG